MITTSLRARRLILGGLAAVVIAALCRSASAASFDCAKAKLPHDRVICADATLSKLDEELARAYRAASAKLSNEGKRVLRDGQRSWLRFARTFCPMERGDLTVWEEPAACLRAIYETRIKELAQAVQEVGSFVFVSVERFDAKHFVARDESDEIVTDDFITDYRAYPQIDKPRGVNIETWNRHIAEISRSWGHYGSRSLKSFRIFSASEAHIGIEFGGW